MTWPWVLHLRDTAGDAADSYLMAWILWWNYHGTFTDPLNLFQANIFYPYRYTLAFSENIYGVALPFFPLYALGFKPLTVHGVATLAGFTLCGYGMFRLARTLTGSYGVAWVAGVAFAFVPYRFHHLPHIPYLWAGWIPLVLEALVLFARQNTKRRAVWLGIAFFMNALSCIHWFVLTLIPLALTAALLLVRYRAGLRTFLIRGGAALGVAFIALLPVLIPYLQVARLYGFARGPAEVAAYSAHLSHWLRADWQNKFWHNFGSGLGPYQTELALFPGLLPILFALVAVFSLMPKELKSTGAAPLRVLIIILDLIAAGSVILMLLVVIQGGVKLYAFGSLLFSSSSLERPFFYAVLALLLRSVLSRAHAIRSFDWRRLFTTENDTQAIAIGTIWTIVGFAGSFGMNFIFHRTLYEFVPLFRSTRVPARWAMICYVGLSLLAAIGVRRAATALTKRRITVVYLLAVALFLFEQREAPLSLIHGAVDADAVTLRLRDLPMKGGIVELPSGTGNQNYLYALRAADHQQPLINGVSGFLPMIPAAIERMSNSDPIPDRLLDLLEAIPASYLVVHRGAVPIANQQAVDAFLRRAVSVGRLRLVGLYDAGATKDELYVVRKTEPEPTPQSK